MSTLVALADTSEFFFFNSSPLFFVGAHISQSMEPHRRRRLGNTSSLFSTKPASPLETSLPSHLKLIPSRISFFDKELLRNERFLSGVCNFAARQV